MIANTGDDVEMYGVHVSPDPDLVTYWLADAIDERGYGIRGDTWEVMDALAGEDTWFRLGDRDLAMCKLRTEAMAAGATPTDAHAAVVRTMNVDAAVLPATDAPLRTVVNGLPFQEFMILARGPVESVEFTGAADAAPGPQVLAALTRADAIVIGPSNPIASIGPMLAIPGMREALAAASAPVVAVSPFVGGEVLKGPTLEFCRWAGVEPTAAGVAEHYSGLLDGIVADEQVRGLPGLVTDTLLDTPDARARVARETLDFAESLRAA